jgi:hypothetical protein
MREGVAAFAVLERGGLVQLSSATRISEASDSRNAAEASSGSGLS